RGAPVSLVNLDSGEKVQVSTGPAEIATCNPHWCQMAVLGADNAVVEIDLQKPDGSGRRRVAGNEATPTVNGAALLDRFIPFKTDDDGADTAPGLSVYDITTGQTQLLASDVTDAQGYDGMLWWSTGTGTTLFWHALDLRTAP